MIGISGFRFLKATNFEVTKGALVFGGQVVSNLIWSPLFFRLRKVGLAFADILLLLGMIGWNIYEFKKVDSLSAKLLIPYFMWVSFATYLNGVHILQEQKKELNNLSLIHI